MDQSGSRPELGASSDVRSSALGVGLALLPAPREPLCQRRAEGEEGAVGALHYKECAGEARQAGGPSPAGERLPDVGEGGCPRDQLAVCLSHMKPRERGVALKVWAEGGVFLRDIGKAEPLGALLAFVVADLKAAERAGSVEVDRCFGVVRFRGHGAGCLWFDWSP